MEPRRSMGLRATEHVCGPSGSTAHKSDSQVHGDDGGEHGVDVLEGCLEEDEVVVGGEGVSL